MITSRVRPAACLQPCTRTGAISSRRLLPPRKAIRSHLMLLAIGAVLPVLAFAILVSIVLVARVSDAASATRVVTGGRHAIGNSTGPIPRRDVHGEGRPARRRDRLARTFVAGLSAARAFVAPGA